MKKRRLLLIWFVLLALALPVAARSHAELAPGGRTPHKDVVPIDDSLLERVRAGEHVPVIVGLDIPFQPESELPGVQAVQEQQAAIAQAQQALRARLAAFALESVEEFRSIPYMALVVDEATLLALAHDPAVRSIKQDHLQDSVLANSVPFIGAPLAWEIGYAGAGWSIAVIDAGVESSHSFLSNKVVAEACFSTSQQIPAYTISSLCPNGEEVQIGSGAGVNCPTSLDGCEHGTHVAGIAAGKGEESSGVARDATIIAINAGSLFSSDNFLICADLDMPAPCSVHRYSSSDVISALEHVYNLRTEHKIAAVNLSLGSGGYTSVEACDADHPAYKAIVDNLRSAGIVTIAASGNNGFINGMSSPACISSVVSVGSVSQSDNVSGFSNSASFLDLLAPGSFILSSVPGNTYDFISGTSMATPHVAGAWAVLKSERPEATVDELLSRLKSTGQPVTDTKSGIITPRIRIDQALTSETLPAAPTDLQAEAVSPSEIQLTWQDQSTNEQSFRIERRLSGSDDTDDQDGWEEIGSVAADTTTFSDNSAVCSARYTYQVQAVNEAGLSGVDDSAQISISPSDSFLCGGVQILSNSKQQQAGAPNMTVRYTLDIENIGPEEDTFTIAVSGAAWNTQAARSSITLASRARASFEVAVEIPAHASITDSDTATVTVSSQADNTQTSSSTLHTTVYAITVAPLASTATPGQTATYTLAIENPGTVAQTFVIEATGFNWSTSLTTTDATTATNTMLDSTTSSSNMLLQTASITATVAGGESASVVVLVDVPAAVESGASDEATLRVWLPENPDQQRSFVIETSTAQPSLYLPLVMLIE